MGGERKKEYIYKGICPDCGHTQTASNGIGRPFKGDTEMLCNKCKKFFKYNKAGNSATEVTIENNKVTRKEVVDVRTSRQLYS